MELEYIGTILALLSVFLLIKQKQIAWLFVTLASFLYMLIFWRGGLYNQAILQIFFILSATYGYSSWGKDNKNPLQPVFGRLVHNLLLILAFLCLSLINWKYAGKIFPGEIAFLDSLTSVFSILAMLLATRKKIESWIYWLVIDAFSISLFISSNLYPTALLYSIYLIMSIWGLKDWLGTQRKNAGTESANRDR